MTFDPDRLLNWRVPEVNHRLTRCDTAFYALSTGWGDDPLDRKALAYVDPGHAQLTASPAMALVLGYPGFWLSTPELQLDAGRILHLDQSIDLVRPVPVEGRITGRTRVIELFDRGSARGALLVSERRLYCDGEPFGRVTQTHLLRSEGGFAGSSAVPAARRTPPQHAADHTIVFAIPPNAALLYRLNGDMNPIHADPDAAAAVGFDRPILHGMATFGYAIGRLVRAMNGVDLRHLGMRFTAPVFPGETLRLNLWNNGQFSAIKSDGTVVIDQGIATEISHD